MRNAVFPLLLLSACAAHRHDANDEAADAPSSERSMPVTVTKEVSEPEYGNAPIPVYVSYDPEMAKAAAYSAAFRARWMEANGMAPPDLGAPMTPNSGPTAAPASSSRVVANVPCPVGRAPVTQAEVDACQEAEISGIKKDLDDQEKTTDALIEAVGVDHPK